MGGRFGSCHVQMKCISACMMIPLILLKALPCRMYKSSLQKAKGMLLFS